MLVPLHIAQKWAVIYLFILSTEITLVKYRRKAKIDHVALDIPEVYTANISNTTDEKIVKKVEKAEPERIRFFLFHNPENISDTQELSLDDPDSILHSKFSVDEPVKILIHGFNGDCQDLPFPRRALEEYLLLKKETNSKVNLICVDWEYWSRYDGIANFVPVYILGRISYSGQISRKTTRLILFLRDAKMIKSLSDVHIVGSSLGAHISGSTGLALAEQTGQKVGRISGLDPAGPLFREWPDLDEQLDKSDAVYVDVYHTSMRRAGLEGKYGHVDFYVNGGVSQPSCSEPKPINLLFQTITEDLFGLCSHNIIGNYWADSIRNSNITACQTDSYRNFRRIKSSKSGCKPEDTVIFGENAPTSAQGKYFLDLDAKYTPEIPKPRT